jgi:ankyrin repeat protein
MTISDNVELKFFQCEESGHILAIKETDEGANVVEPEEALLEAARRGISGVVKGLLTVGQYYGDQRKARSVDVNATNERKQTAMHLAILRRNGQHWLEQEFLEIVKLLLKANADVDAKDLDGQTPMHYAVSYFNSKARELLLQEGSPDVGIQDVNGNCPLQTAASWPNLEAIQALRPVYMKQRKYKQALLEGYLNEWPRARYRITYKQYFRAALVAFLLEAKGLIVHAPFDETTVDNETSVEQYTDWLEWAVAALEAVASERVENP